MQAAVHIACFVGFFQGPLKKDRIAKEEAA